MTLIPWSDKFSINVEIIDQQHRRLFDLINSIHTLIKNGVQGKELDTRIDALIDYTNYHFTEEESYMSGIGYPRLDQHKIAHENLTDQVVSFKKKLSAGEESADRFITFLFDWLTKHIMDQDKKIGKYVEQNTLKPYEK